MKWGLRVVAATVLLVVLLSIAIATILNSESGTRWALARIDAALAGELVVQDVSGTFWQGLNVSSLQYRDQNREIRATSATVRVDWSGIFTGQVTLREVQAATLEIRNRHDSAIARTPFTVSMTPLPIGIALTHGTVAEFTIAGSGETRRIENITVHAGTIRGQTIRARAVAGSMNGIGVDAKKVRLTLAGEAPAAAQLAWTLADGTWSGKGQLRGSLSLLAFEQTVSGPYPFQASGTAQLLRQTEPVFDAALSWENWVVSDYQLPRGSARLRGTTGNYDIDYRAGVIAPNAIELQVSGTGNGNLRQFTAFSAEVQSGYGHADLRGALSWLPAFSAVADVEANGQFNGAALVAHGAVELAPPITRCTLCVVTLGENTLRLDGQMVDGELSWNVQVDLPELHLLRNDLAGRVGGGGRLRGTLELPQFSGAVQAQQLVFGDWTAAEIAIDSQGSTLDAVNIRATIAELKNGGNNYGSFDVRGTGKPDNVQLDVNGTIRGLTIDAAGAVQANGMDLSGRVERALIHEPQTGDWQLQQAFSFHMVDLALTIEPHAWAGDSGMLQLSRLAFSSDEAAIVASIERFPLGLADFFLPQDSHLTGLASANIDVTRRADAWSGTLQWQQADTVLRIAADKGRNTDVRVPRAELQANFRDGGVVARASIAIEPGVNSELDLHLSTLDSDAHLQAELRFGGDDWSWITAVIPEIDRLQGSITASLNANGPLLAPALSGDIEWRNGRLLLPALNAPLDDIDLVISGAPQGTATLTGTARAGDGTLAVGGHIDSLMQASRSITLELTGKSAEMINWPEYHVWGSPDLNIVGDASGWQLGGELTVPRANIEIREIPVEATTVSTDVVVLDDEEIHVEPTRIAGQVRLKLGKRVRVKALGLDTGLSGELLVRLQQDREMSAEGRISLIDGSFAAQGQKLTIQRGELTFTGPLDNPIVDVRAVRVIETFDGTVTAGIHLHGRAQNLTSTVFAEPAMSDVDALSYLVIGRPLNQATEAEGGELSGAAVSLGLRQATRLTEQIGLSMGLDQLSLSGDGSDTTTLIAGKKINSRLYARYAYGIFSRLGTLLMRYRLSERLALEAGAGEYQSIDILFSVEKP